MLPSVLIITHLQQKKITSSSPSSKVISNEVIKKPLEAVLQLYPIRQQLLAAVSVTQTVRAASTLLTLYAHNCSTLL